MDDARIKSLLEQASERYNEGAYAEAIALWQEALHGDPSNQKAREGIRMASLLVSSEGMPSTGPEAPDDRVTDGLLRVRELLAAGETGQALEGIILLRELAPGLAELDALEQEARGLAPDAGGETMSMPVTDVETLLEQARSALAEGREEDAARSAAIALQMEPGNMEACGILSLTGQNASVGEPPETAADEPPPDHDTAPHRAIPPSAVARPAASARPRAPEGGEQTARIAALLAEGQVAFDQARMQDAIATWSRIFALNPSHAEAGRRIDQAKALIDEQAREVDDLYYRAVDAQDSGRLPEALALFQQVLQLNPQHLDAQKSAAELADRLENGDVTFSLDTAAAREVAEEKGPAGGETLYSGSEAVPLAMPSREHRPAPERLPRPIPMPEPPRSGRGRLFAMVGGIVVFAGVGVGAWLWLGTGGSMPEAEATTALPVRPASRAAQKAAEEPTAPLQVVPGAAAVQPAPPPQADQPPAPSDPREAMDRAREAYRAQRWADAVLAYREALRLNPADFDAQEQLDHAMTELEKQARYEREMDDAMKMFGEADYGGSLRKLYRLQQDYPKQRHLDGYIRNCWYNWGVSLIQSGDVDEAADKFSEVLELDPRDEISRRARDVARRYHGRPRDSVLESFAAAMPQRPIDAR